MAGPCIHDPNAQAYSPRTVYDNKIGHEYLYFAIPIVSAMFVHSLLRSEEFYLYSLYR